MWVVAARFHRKNGGRHNKPHAVTTKGHNANLRFPPSTPFSQRSADVVHG